MSELEMLALLLTSIDGKTLNLMRYYEHQIEFLRRRVKGRLLPDEAEKAAFANLAKEIGRPDLAVRMNLFHPETLFRWHREQAAKKFDGATKRGPGRPPRWSHILPLLSQLRQDNPNWGVHRLSGQLHSLGYDLHPETIRQLLLKHGLDPGPAPSDRWVRFIAQHQSAMLATDFLTVEVGTQGFLRTFHVLFLIQLDTRKVHIAGITENPDQAWMTQVARNLIMEGENFVRGRNILLMDRDAKFCKEFRDILSSGGLKSLRLPWRSPNLNAFAERWVRSIKTECLRSFIFFDEEMLRRVITSYIQHYNHERPHQGKDNQILLPQLPERTRHPSCEARLQSKSKLGGLLNFYYWEKENQEIIAA